MKNRVAFPDFEKAPRAVRIWLITGLVMIFMQIVIGGVTRLTGSGLSITRWEIVTGAVPPLGHAEWEEAFALYQQTPQYHKINRGMSLDEFRFIYFWEYFHRLWARLMFFVFVFPFAWFWWRGWLSKRLRTRLWVVVALAGLEGFFGWIMVASGLIHRPWVNAYNLTLHLCLGFIIFAYLLWTVFIAYRPQLPVSDPRDRRFAWALVGIAFFQIALGAMMSGTKAALFYPTWPDMQGSYLPGVLLDAGFWKGESFTHYDTNPFMPALIQFLHRNTAYVLSALVIYFSWKKIGTPAMPELRKALWGLLTVLGLQVLLGILTLLYSRGVIPVLLGVLHQAGAVVLVSAMLWVTYLFSGKGRMA